MSQRFIKGLTNNHLTWVMVDSTDFATPESALSAATKIKIYGKLRSATGTNLVSSGTGSLTNDITHVGASATGMYTIALAKADLSDASAAWYDQYIISLSATGAAYQTLIVDGGILESYLSDIASYLSATVSDIRSDVSDMHSDLIVMSGILSDAYSGIVALSGAVSDVYSALSDFQSDFGSRVPKEVSARSQLSDLASDIRSVLIVNQSAVSDIASVLSQLESQLVMATLNRSIRGICIGTVGAASTTTNIVTSSVTPAGAAADQFKGRIVIFDRDTTTASLRGQATDITASSNAAAPELTVTALTTAPASGDTFVIQ